MVLMAYRNKTSRISVGTLVISSCVTCFRRCSAVMLSTTAAIERSVESRASDVASRSSAKEDSVDPELRCGSGAAVQR